MTPLNSFRGVFLSKSFSIHRFSEPYIDLARQLLKVDRGSQIYLFPILKGISIYFLVPRVISLQTKLYQEALIDIPPNARQPLELLYSTQGTFVLFNNCPEWTKLCFVCIEGHLLKRYKCFGVVVFSNFNIMEGFMYN